MKAIVETNVEVYDIIFKKGSLKIRDNKDLSELLRLEPIYDVAWLVTWRGVPQIWGIYDDS